MGGDRTFVERDTDYRQGEGIVPEFFGTARTKDGKYIVVVSTESALFAKAFNRPDIAKALGNPVTIREKMAEEIGKYNEDEVIAGAQVQHNKIVETINDPNFGPVRQA